MLRRVFLSLLASLFAQSVYGQIPLDKQLDSEDPASLAADARSNGDPRRGALIFYRPQSACVSCHGTGDSNPQLGPELARLTADTTDAHLIESLLHPSKVIKQEFRGITVATKDGNTFTGLLLDEKPDELTIRNAGTPQNIVTINRNEIEEIKKLDNSLMPAGIVNTLASRDEFRDLVAYLQAITDGGVAKALALKPDPAALAPKPLPAYEASLDHARLLSILNQHSLERGAAIYNQICVNCHGNKEAQGSMPTSLRFHQGKFKNGSDPLSIYKTVTSGYGQMPAQMQLVPRQKYDVIHYIRETFLKNDNPSQYATIDSNYLASLPKGTEIGPIAEARRPWLEMDYGNVLHGSFEVSKDGSNIAIKGIAFRLNPGEGGIAQGNTFVVYDHDTMRMVGAWTGKGFIDWAGINFDGRHMIHPKVVGDVHASLLDIPGWANPENPNQSDARILGRNGRPYGPLPKSWIEYKGLEHPGESPTLKYKVGGISIQESPSMVQVPNEPDKPAFYRSFLIDRPNKELELRVCQDQPDLSVVVVGSQRLERKNGLVVVHVKPSNDIVSFDVTIHRSHKEKKTRFIPKDQTIVKDSRSNQTLSTSLRRGKDDGAFAFDVFETPDINPWRAQMRLGGLDFFAGGRSVAVCTWDGDVWLVEGLLDRNGKLTWRRFAQGLFQPLGLKIVNEQIFVCCRDQLVKLEDKDRDGLADSYVCFNSDHIMTESFHEFAMDLQTDREGNFYYAKGARHAQTPIVPHHGTLLKVAADGSKTEILATGFRAPNGVCVNDDGTFLMTDQEGHWIPKNRINWIKPGKFYGNMWGYHNIEDTSDGAMEQPIVWITNVFDRSPSEIIRVEDKKWGALFGRYLNLSYGYGKTYLLMDEMVGETRQGGLVELPIMQFPTGVMRGRFNPVFGDLYACGLFGWAGNQEQPGGLYRVRATGKPLQSPLNLKTSERTVTIEFASPLDHASAAASSNYALTAWNLQRSKNYGSKHIDEHLVPIESVRVGDDGRTVTLTAPNLRTTNSLEIRYQIKASTGEPIDGRIHSTIHVLRPATE